MTRLARPAASAGGAAEAMAAAITSGRKQRAKGQSDSDVGQRAAERQFLFWPAQLSPGADWSRRVLPSWVAKTVASPPRGSIWKQLALRS
jgi:hypothetical protein